METVIIFLWVKIMDSNNRAIDEEIGSGELVFGEDLRVVGEQKDLSLELIRQVKELKVDTDRLGGSAFAVEVKAGVDNLLRLLRANVEHLKHCEK